MQRHSPSHLFWRGVIAGLAGAAMGVGLYPLATNAGVRALRRRRGVRHPIPPAKVAAEWGLALALTASRPLGFLGLPVARTPALGPRPIILIHGYAMNRASFLWLARRLHRAGLGPLYGFEYWSLGTVAGAARRLAEYVDKISAATGASEVDLVGHSMGGVVGRYFVTLGGGGARVANLITLGSPHGGTEASLFGVGRPQRELLPGSNLLERLRRAPRPRSQITVIWSRGDSLVWSPHQAQVAGHDELVYDDLGHLALLVSRRVAREIVARLSAPAVARTASPASIAR